MDVRHHVPTIGFETFGHIFAECQFGKALYRDLVVVVEIDQFPEFEMSCERSRFRSYSLH